MSCDSSGFCAAIITVSSTAHTTLSTTMDQAIRARTSDRHGRGDTSSAPQGALERDETADCRETIAHVGQPTASGGGGNVLWRKADAVIDDTEAGGSIGRQELGGYVTGVGVLRGILHRLRGKEVEGDLYGRGQPHITGVYDDR